MTPDEQFHQILSSLHNIERGIEALNQALQVQQPAPRLEFHLSAYNDFDWESIGASPAQADSDGVTMVWWNNRQYIRRSLQNKFGIAIIFSRSLGEDEQGNAQYERLVRFSDTEVDSLGKKVKAGMREQPSTQQLQQQRPQKPATATQQQSGNKQITREQWLARQKQRQDNAC